MHTTKRTLVTAIMVLVAITLCPTTVTGDTSPVGTTFTYQGRLTQQGQPVTGSVDLVFRLFAVADGGSPPTGAVLFADDFEIGEDGHFTMDLDFGDHFTGEPRWLEIEVNGQTLSPRQPIMATPHAMVATTAANVPSKAVVGVFGGITGVGTLDSLNVTGNVGIGTNNPQSHLHIDGTGSTIQGIDLVNPGSATGRYVIGSPAGNIGMSAFAANDNRRDIRFTDTGIVLSASSSSGIPSASNGLFIHENGLVGIRTTSPEYPLHVSGRIFASSNSWVIRGHRTQATGTFPAVWGQTESASSGTAGVRGDANHTSPGATAAGVYGHNFSTSANGYGVRARHDGRGVGVYASSRYGIGVWSEVVDSFSTNIGGNSIGVFGRAVLAGPASAVGLEGIGGQLGGDFANPNTNAAYGVLGQTQSSTWHAGPSWAVYAIGSLGASGTKSFEIDHPLDPENKWLRHYSTESPEPQNFYNGTIDLDGNGEAWVHLPDYFDAINRDPRYTLTPIGAAMPNLHIAAEIADGRFRIAGGSPGNKVSWRVDAIRDDLYVRTAGAPIEVEKPDSMRGTYLHPELYDLPRERATHYRPTRAIDGAEDVLEAEAAVAKSTQ